MRVEMRTRRIALGLTQREVSNRMGMTQFAYANIERGDKNPSALGLLKLLDILGGDPKELMQNTPLKEYHSE